MSKLLRWHSSGIVISAGEVWALGDTVYGRYREWLKESRWQRVLEALRTDGVSTVEEEVAP